MSQVNAVRNTDTHHLCAFPTDKQAWEARAAELREQILVSAGLYPLPAKKALHPRVTGRYEGVDFTVESVTVETVPGFYLCGNLYSPKGKQGPFPAIVNPHGHWQQGRLTREPDVAKAASAPAEPGEGKADLVAIGVNLARQGYVVFSYDMVGYADTTQVDHKFAGNLNAWQHGVSLMGFQLWNSIRAVDYVAGLKDVDRERIGATGASGGGTQTFLLCAVEPRVKAAVPVNMVSAYMQGGCLCENGPGLRVGTDNVEIAALFAPKPLLLVAATGDWTKHVPQEELPAIKKVYAMYGAADRVTAQQFNYQHNYNVESREAMYAWFGRWLLHDTDASHFRERPCDIDSAKLHVWTTEHPRPADALDAVGLEHALIARAAEQRDALLPRDGADGARFRKTAAPLLRHALGVSAPKLVAKPRARTTLVVGVNGDSSVDETAQALRSAGRTVKTLSLPSITMNPGAMWDGFYSCYNRVPLGDRVQAIMDAMDGSTDLVGVGAAGVWTLLARALVPGGKLQADFDGLDPTDDAALTQRLYAPCLFAKLDMRAITLMCMPGEVSLRNVGNEAWRDDVLKTLGVLHKR